MPASLDLLVCPVCHAALEPRAGGVTCSGCAREFVERGSSLDLTPNPPPDADVAERWPLWEQLQHNFLVAAEEIPEASLSVGPREDALEFARFAALEGLVLDVGCGPQRHPSYAIDFPGRFVGMDPVPGEPEREFEFVQAVGEYLPFADETFDRMLFATSLDHMLSPRRALAETRRVLKPDGTVSIWFGVIEDEKFEEPANSPPRLAVALRSPRAAARALVRRLRPAPVPAGPAYERELRVPEGASDLFHVDHPGQPEIEGWLEDVGLKVRDVAHVARPRSAFLRAGRAEG